MRRFAAAYPLAALALAACAQPQGAPPPPQAAAPKPAPAFAVSMDPAGVIRVTGPAPGEDALEALHCTAAKQARTVGSATLEWVGGVARRKAEGVAADLVYQTGPGPAPALSDPALGGAASIESWLAYCDKAGLPREDEA